MGASKENRLDSGDAEFVDVVHSNSAPFNLGYYGNCGHVDFYPNGGDDQPGCNNLDAPCSHSASYKFYAESITKPDIIACKCDLYFPDETCLNPCVEPVIFGEHCPTT